MFGSRRGRNVRINAGCAAVHARRALHAENRRDPHPGYHWARANHPIWYEPLHDDWLLTRWADCEAVLR